MQAALDLADMGLKVYLMDERTTIGGNMARLDKTFPTNDCSMCILSPKLVAAGRHPNLQLLMNAEIKGISGKPGKFKVKVKRYATYIDESKCTGAPSARIIVRSKGRTSSIWISPRGRRYTFHSLRRFR